MHFILISSLKSHLNLTTSLRGRICFSIFQMRKWKTIYIKPKDCGSRVQAPAIILHPPTMEYIHMHVCIYCICIYNVHASITCMHPYCTCIYIVHASIMCMHTYCTCIYNVHASIMYMHISILMYHQWKLARD